MCEDLRQGDTSSKEIKVKKKGSSKVKNGRSTQRMKADCSGNKEVLEDDEQSVTSSAVEEACHDLRKDQPSGKLRP